MMKKLILLLVGFGISNSVIAAQYECENSGRITYQDEACNAAQCMNAEEPTDLNNLFDKVSVRKLTVQKGRISGENTELLFEVDAINDSPNKVKLTLKYDGLDKKGFTIDTQSISGTIESYSKIKIKSSNFYNFKKTALVNNIVQWRFNSWSAEINK
jgi:hypothetical protein